MTQSKGRRFIDEYGDTWVLIVAAGVPSHVVRERDGNNGGWWNGKGLVEL